MLPFIPQQAKMGIPGARAYIKVLNGCVAVFSSGVVDKGTLVFQQHLDAVNRPGSDTSSQDRKEQRY